MLAWGYQFVASLPDGRIIVESPPRTGSKPGVEADPTGFTTGGGRNPDFVGFEPFMSYGWGSLINKNIEHGTNRTERIWITVDSNHIKMMAEGELGCL